MDGFEFLTAYQKLDEKTQPEPLIVMLSSSLNRAGHQARYGQWGCTFSGQAAYGGEAT